LELCQQNLEKMRSKEVSNRYKRSPEFGGCRLDSTELVTP
jgi:hypothetical protein